MKIQLKSLTTRAVYLPAKAEYMSFIRQQLSLLNVCAVVLFIHGYQYNYFNSAKIQILFSSDNHIIYNPIRIFTKNRTGRCLGVLPGGACSNVPLNKQQNSKLYIIVNFWFCFHTTY